MCQPGFGNRCRHQLEKDISNALTAPEHHGTRRNRWELLYSVLDYLGTTTEEECARFTEEANIPHEWLSKIAQKEASLRKHRTNVIDDLNQDAELSSNFREHLKEHRIRISEIHAREEFEGESGPISDDDAYERLIVLARTIDAYAKDNPATPDPDEEIVPTQRTPTRQALADRITTAFRDGNLLDAAPDLADYLFTLPRQEYHKLLARTGVKETTLQTFRELKICSTSDAHQEALQNFHKEHPLTLHALARDIAQPTHARNPYYEDYRALDTPELSHATTAISLEAEGDMNVANRWIDCYNITYYKGGIRLVNALNAAFDEPRTTGPATADIRFIAAHNIPNGATRLSGRIEDSNGARCYSFEFPTRAAADLWLSENLILEARKPTVDVPEEPEAPRGLFARLTHRKAA